MADPRTTIRVEVVFVTPASTWATTLQLPIGSTVARAMDVLRGIDERPEGLDAAIHASRFGVFGRRVDDEDVLSEGDRLELYRPLTADPKDARRRRAARTG